MTALNPDSPNLHERLERLERFFFGENNKKNGALDELNRLTLLIDGDERKDVRGIRNTLKDHDEVIQQWREMKLIVRGMAIVLTISTAANVGTIYTALKAVGLIQ